MRRLLVSGLLLVWGGIAWAYEITPKIYGGSDARSGDWPWMAYLIIQDPTAPNQVQLCGGVLIAPDIVLSAAHCVFNGATPPQRAERIYLSVNTTVRPSGIEQTDARALGPGNIVVHTGYAPGSDVYNNDIVLLKLEETLDVPRYPILGTQADFSALENLSPARRDDILIAMGWGETENVAAPFPTRLQQVRLDYIPRGVCNSQWGRTTITSNMICAAEPNPGNTSGRDTCRGDSGGPLVWGTPASPVVVGLTSFGTNTCGTGTPPSVYTHVAPYIEWVEKNAAARGRTLVDVSAVLPRRLRSGIGTTTTLSWQVRNDSRHNHASQISFSLYVPAGLNIDNIRGADCVQADSRLNCGIPGTLAAGEARNLSLDIAHLTDSEITETLMFNVTQEEFDYRRNNNSAAVTVTFTDRRPSSGSSGGSSGFYLLPLLALLARRRRG